MAVTSADFRAYQQDGVILLRGAFADWVEALRVGTEALMAAPGPYERSYTPKDGSARFFQDLCNWQRIPEFRDFVERGPGASIARALMGSEGAQFFHDHVLVKEPGTSIVTPWHQDSPYYCVGGQQSVSFWIPLDPVAREVTLECVAGSQRWGKNHKPKRFDGTDLYEGDTAEDMPDIDARRGEFRILGWEMQPGDAVAFDFRTIHGAPANTNRHQRRRVFSARWVGDDAFFIDRQGRGSPPLRHLTLKTGDKLSGPEFPRFT
ncbi:phytanoyl-CoA dioxygenase family protein [Sabulicella rubraurantiaca]|uniref:phytanoyl-CoA dioxygenase family protein n=1 Tax=Sabulicella rubraurantiaca TaxID=2811429 RepID=UPI001A961B50|nr:phytanoyl-CoA dioxygenase family protein [Sabulicella rubraurantiaca]